MVDIRMMMQRTVLFTNLTAIFTGFAMFGAFVLLPSFMQTHRGGNVHYGFGLSPTATGLYLLPGGLLGFVAGPIAGRLGTRYGSRLPLILGMVLAACGIASLALFHAHPLEISARDGVHRDRRPVRVCRDGEADRRRGAAVGDGRRHRHEHGHADDRLA